MGAISNYNLKGLSPDHSWTLFLKCAFKDGLGHDTHSQNLVEIGKKLVDKCKGIPLVVRNLGCLLYSNLDEKYWRHIGESKICEVENDIFGLLLVSYVDLPSHLRRCFLFCSLLPKDKVIFSLDLIQLWMAHGVLSPEGDKNRSLVDIGHQYFRELSYRSFFQHVKNQVWCYTFSVQHLIHDFAQSVAQSECWTSPTNISPESENCNRVRHLAISEISGDEFPTWLDKLNSVRTLVFRFLVTESLSNSFFNRYLRKYEYLRMLDLSYSSFETLPSYIGRMKQLRSLNLSHNRKICNLPDSIYKLQSLKILRLEGCSKLEKLPRNIGNLSSLEFLSMTTTELCFPRNGIRCLTSLRTLMIVSCNKLTYLSDKIMGRLTALVTLVISDCENMALFDDEDEQVGPLSLQNLIFTDLPKMEAIPRWLQGCQSTLQYLFLASCTNLTALPSWLPNTASLQRIEIGTCPRLSALPQGMHHLAFPVELRTFKCPVLKEYLGSDGKNGSLNIHFDDHLEQQSQMRVESSTSGNSRQNERFRTKEKDDKLIQTLLEVQRRGKFNAEDPFNLEHLEAIKRFLVDKFPEFDPTTEDRESRIKTLHEMVTRPNSTGFLRDSEKKNIATAEIEAWDASSEKDANAMICRNNATMKISEITPANNVTEEIEGTEGKVNVTQEEEIKDSAESTNEENDHHAGPKDSSQAIVDPNSSFSNSSLVIRREISTVGFEDIGAAINEAAHVIAREIRDSTSSLTRGIFQEIREKYTRLNDELSKIATLTVVERHRATRLISQNNATVDIFFSLTDEEKEEWVRALLSGSI